MGKMATLIIYLLYFIGIIVSLIIFYYVVKAAVKNGIKEARIDQNPPIYIKQQDSERFANPEQTKLQQRYDKGEITFDVYQSEWNKLSS
jgi:hypothetical protein